MTQSLVKLVRRSDMIALRQIARELHKCNTAESNGHPDAGRERDALKRLDAVLQAYPTLSYHLQGDPRGPALYILRPGDVPPGGEPDAYYTRGVAIVATKKESLREDQGH